MKKHIPFSAESSARNVFPVSFIFIGTVTTVTALARQLTKFTVQMHKYGHLVIKHEQQNAILFPNEFWTWSFRFWCPPYCFCHMLDHRFHVIVQRVNAISHSYHLPFLLFFLTPNNFSLPPPKLWFITPQLLSTCPNLPGTERVLYSAVTYTLSGCTKVHTNLPIPVHPPTRLPATRSHPATSPWPLPYGTYGMSSHQLAQYLTLIFGLPMPTVPIPRGICPCGAS